jgi:hypothetical protein
MSEAFSVEMLRGPIQCGWHAVYHRFDLLQHDLGLQAHFFCTIFPVPLFHFFDLIFASDFHCEAGFVRVDFFWIGEGARDVVEWGEADLALARDQDRVVFGMGVGAFDEPVEDEGVGKS